MNSEFRWHSITLHLEIEMAKTTSIGWTDHTWNPWLGCHKVSEECRYCYISGIIGRMGKKPFGGPMRTKNWRAPLSWDTAAAKEGVRRRVFTCSISDFFHDGADDWRPEAWRVIQDCQTLDWLVLTKRPELILDRLPADWGEGYANVWLGVTAGCTDSLWRLDHLREIPAKLKFVSVEPLLERLDFRPYMGWLDWVITGCERAHKGKRRLMDMDWVREIDIHCREAGVAHYFKQHYIDNRGNPVYDGLLDGKVRQAWPEIKRSQSNGT